MVQAAMYFPWAHASLPQPKNYLGHDQQIGRPRYLAAYVFNDGRHHVTIGL